ncbi:MAG: hypothetical protein CMF48_01225 [Legionellales bacterium]|nr:hypothetical protein [Legionellales bacterium]|tara:strand:- start:540 stop:1157 length:618 start_codon:yes stop_codon:yes gene_type:complete
MPYTTHLILEVKTENKHPNQVLKHVITNDYLLSHIIKLNKGKTSPYFNNRTPSSLKIANHFFRLMGTFFDTEAKIKCHFQYNGQPLKNQSRTIGSKFARGHHIRRALGFVCLVLLAPLFLLWGLVAAFSLLANRPRIRQFNLTISSAPIEESNRISAESDISPEQKTTPFLTAYPSYPQSAKVKLPLEATRRLSTTSGEKFSYKA